MSAVFVATSDVVLSYVCGVCDHKHRSCVYGSRSGNYFCRSVIHD